MVIKCAHPRRFIPKGQKLWLPLSTKSRALLEDTSITTIQLLYGFLEDLCLPFLEHSFHAGPLWLTSPYGCSVANSEVQDLVWSRHVLFHKHSEEGSTLDFLSFSKGWDSSPSLLCCKVSKAWEHVLHWSKNQSIPSLFRERPKKNPKNQRQLKSERGASSKMQHFAPMHYGFFFLSLDVSQSSRVPLTDTLMQIRNTCIILKRTRKACPPVPTVFPWTLLSIAFSSSQWILTAPNRGSRWHTFNTSFNNPPCNFRQTELQQITRQQIFGGIMPEEASCCQDNLNTLGAQRNSEINSPLCFSQRKLRLLLDKH